MRTALIRLAAVVTACFALTVAAEEKNFEVAVSAPPTVAPGSKGELVLSVKAKAGYKVNAEYPHAYKVGDKTSAGVRFDAKKVDLKAGSEKTPCKDSAADACAMTAKVPFTADKTAKGAQTIDGVFAFSVCSKDVCLIEKHPVAVTVEVK